MAIDEALAGVSRLFVDTAPVIYLVENNKRYSAIVRTIFDRVDKGEVAAVTSPITLAECLVHPYRRKLAQLEQDFLELIVSGANTVFVTIDAPVARRAAELRARYNLVLDDAIQIAAAINADCQAFLTNDIDLKRVAELKMIVLDDFVPAQALADGQTG